MSTLIKYQKGQKVGNFIFKERLPYKPRKDAVIKAIFICPLCNQEFSARVNYIKEGKLKSCGCDKRRKSIYLDYKGYTIKKKGGYTNYFYQIFKNGNLYSSLALSTIDVAKKIIDKCSKIAEIPIPSIFQDNPKPIKKIAIKDTKSPPKLVREVYLSEHEKYIKKLLDEK